MILYIFGCLGSLIGRTRRTPLYLNSGSCQRELISGCRTEARSSLNHTEAVHLKSWGTAQVGYINQVKALNPRHSSFTPPSPPAVHSDFD